MPKTTPVSIRGFIQWADDAQTACYFTDGAQVWRASLDSAADSNGFLQGRWECSVSHWNHYADRLGRAKIKTETPWASQADNLRLQKAA